jgi:hypothetical protein
MRRLQSALVVAVLLVATAAPAAIGRAADEESDIGVSLADSVEFRSTFGFETDEDFVLRTLADDSADTTWGTPLTADEAAIMAERQRLEELSEPLATYISERGGSFGGLYFDQDGGRLVATIQRLATTTDDDVDSALKLAPEGLKVNVVMVDHSLSAHEKSRVALGGGAAKNGVKMVGIDTRANGLVATVGSADEASAVAESVEVPIETRVGDGLQPAACWNTCTPWRGGMNIWDQAFPLEGNCTWGFYGTRGSAAKYAISAGHCGKVTHVLRIKDPSNNTIIFTDGVDQNTYDLSGGISQSDSQTAHVKANANAVSPFNKIIASSSDLNHSITSVHSNSQNVGNTVCFFGMTTHRASPCGTITITGITGDVERADDGKMLHVTQQVEMSLSTAGGDSGGPVYNGSSAWGVVGFADAGASNHMVYGMAANVQLNTSTNICVSSAC